MAAMHNYVATVLIMIVSFVAYTNGCEAVEGLQPSQVWKYFCDYTKIPRPPQYYEPISQYLKQFAQLHGFKYREDNARNLVIEIPATKGHENSPTVCFQSHTDMVCEKNSDKEHDFYKDPIQMVRDGEWIRANGTTLGADDGIGGAIAMAIATDESTVHGPLELVFTTDEEIGLISAIEMKPNFLTCKYFLNLDTAFSGTIYIGSAGGENTIGTLQFNTTKPSFEYPAEILVTGLKGGHSGGQIHEQRGNAIKIMARLLYTIMIEHSIPLEIASIFAGSADNAIPRECRTVLFAKEEKHLVKIGAIMQQFGKQTVMQLGSADPNMSIQFAEALYPIETVMQQDDAIKLVLLLLSLPHGMMAKSLAMPKLTETSTNVAILQMKLENNNLTVEITTSQRSSVDSARYALATSVKSIFELSGAKVRTEGVYGGWRPEPNSTLVQCAREAYASMSDSELGLKAIHGGLETGEIASKYPSMELISFGPDHINAHSPMEALNIESVAQVYDFTKNLVRVIAKK